MDSLDLPKKELDDIISKIATDSGVGIDPRYTHAVIIDSLRKLHERLDRIEKQLKG